jgi:HlyD family secretion protein
MIRFLIVVIVILLAVMGWMYARTQRFTPEWAMPKTEKVTIGDIRMPITATGLIEPSQTIEVKTEASGRIIEIPVREGSYVREGDLLVKLNPELEERAADRAKLDLQRAESNLDLAKVALSRAKIAVTTAEAALDESKASFGMTEYDYQKIKKMAESGQYADQEQYNAECQLTMAKARVSTAEANLDTAKLAVDDAEKSVELQGLTVEIAKKSLADADKRLRDTQVKASGSAVVTQLIMQEGMVAASGSGGFSLGTTIMYIADVSNRKVIARLDEADYGRISAIAPVEALSEEPGVREAALADEEGIKQRGGPVRLTVDMYPNESFTGRIELVEPRGRQNAGSTVIQFNVHVVITDERASQLPLGAQAQVEFTVDKADNALRVPSEAIKTYGEQKGVWRKTEPDPSKKEAWGREFVPCRLGVTDGEFTQILEVLDGKELKDGDEVYTKLPPKDTEGDDD